MSQRTYAIDDVKAVILVGGRDFGRCPTATRLNRALWPLAGRPVLQHLVDHIASQGVRRFVLCCENTASQIRQTLQIPAHLDVRFIEETMPRGTAGCIRDAADPGRDELLFVFQACTLVSPDIHDMIQAHRRGNGDMTIFFNPPGEANGHCSDQAQFFLCERSVLDSIPQKGYLDIKEGLVPVLVAAGKTIYSAQLTSPSGTFLRWQQYLHAAGVFLDNIRETQSPPQGFQLFNEGSNVWVGQNVRIDKSVRLCGPVLVESGVHIESDVVILGPAIIGKQVTIEQNAFLEQCVVWENAKIGRNCRICHSLIDSRRNIPSGAQWIRRIAPQPASRLGAFFMAIKERISSPAHLWTDAEIQCNTLADFQRRPRLKWTLAVMTVLLMGLLIVSYWQPTVMNLWHIWLESDEYSCGLLVPFLAAYILWSRRKYFLNCPIKSAWTGLGLLLGAQALRLFGLYYMFASAERLALVFSIGGIVLLLYGGVFFRRFIPIFLFLFLMLPLPNRIESMITLPLQQWATVSAVFSLETLGYSVIRHGNVIQIGDTMVAVAEACNGLRMLTAFFVISGFVVLISKRNRWEKIALLISAIPIALICNTVRLTLTSIAYTWVQSETMEEFFHDFGGLAMMPFAIGIIVFEMWLMRHLFYQPETIEHQVVFSRKE
jgi:exosortase